MLDHVGALVSDIARSWRFRAATGLRPHYHPNCHGALVLDPGGLNVEAVRHPAE